MSTRERKYRAWDGEQMREDILVSADGFAVEITEFNPGGCGDPDCCPQGSDTYTIRRDWIVIEYTGRKDIDNVDIYEGDKLEFMLNGKKEVCPVEWNPIGMWSLRWSEGLNPGPLRGTYKVVGNIFEQ